MSAQPSKKHRVLSLQLPLETYERWQNLITRTPIPANRLFALLLEDAEASLAAQLRKAADELEKGQP